jgi:ribonuclease-3
VIDLLADLPHDVRMNAVTHPAFASSRAESFERLEFLGDSVLDLVITDALYTRFPDLDEGDMSKVRAAAVSREACAIVARDLDLAAAMIAVAAARGSAHEATARRLASQRNTLAALAEGVVGGAFVTHGYEAVAPAILAAFEERIEHALANRVDAKSELQELASRESATVRYDEVGEEGPPHDRRFTMAAVIAGAEGDASEAATAPGQMVGLRAEGSGRSKQEAQQAAAAAVLEQFERKVRE